MDVRTLAIRPRPVLGESFSSYVERIAARQRLPLVTVLRAAGVVTEERTTSLPAGYGVTLSRQAVENFATATRLEVGRVSDMLLRRFSGIAFDFSDVSWDDAAGLRNACRREWVYAAETHVCPHCLGNDGAQLLVWKLPWSFACVRHRCLLAGRCPQCGSRLGSGRPDGRTIPARASQIVELGRCRAPRPGAASPRSPVEPPCGYPLADMRTQSLRLRGAVLNAQQRLDDILETGSGDGLPAVEYLGVLRGLIALILAVGRQDDLTGLPSDCAKAWATYLAARDARAQARQRAVADGRFRRGPRTRTYLAAPDDPALVAAVMPSALAVMEARGGSDAELDAALQWLGDAARETSPGFALEYPRHFKWPQDLAAAYRRVTTRRPFALAVEGASPVRLEARCVPRLYWHERYKRVAPGLVGMSEPFARRFCSMALLRAAGLRRWEAIAQALGYENATGRRIARNGVYALRRCGRAERFWDAINADLTELAAAEELIDYREREQALRGFSNFPDDAWRQLCLRAVVPFGKRGGRRDRSAAWLWAELTSGDWKEAPVFRPPASAPSGDLYHRFEVWLQDNPRFQAELLEWGRSNLQR